MENSTTSFLHHSIKSQPALLLSSPLLKQATMADKDAIRSTDEVSKSTCQLRIKLVPAEMEEAEVDFITYSRKRRKTEKSALAKVKPHNQKKSGRKKSVINGKNGVNEQQIWCHQCRSKKESHVLECKKCQSKKYCVECIFKWYPKISKEEFEKACPFCRNICNCKACLRGSSPKGYSCPKPDKIRYSKHIILRVLPFVRRLNEEQLMEKEIEAKVKGLSVSELQLQDAECEVDDDIYCDNCGAYFFDLYRSCACGYDLCIGCCRELRDGSLEVGKGMKCGWKSCIDGRIPCPPKDIGGCNDGILELKRIMPVDWVVNLLEKAQRIYRINTSDDIDISQTSTKCGMCSDSSNEVIPDIQPQDIQHFQLHWSRGEPVIVNDVLSTSSGLSWEPMVLWRAFRDIKRSKVYEVNAIDCLDWREVSVSFYKFFWGYSEGRFERRGLPVILKLEDWQPSYLYEGELPRHFVEFIGCLPFKEYTHPKNGYLNVAVKLPDLSLKPVMGPRMDIAYGVEEELENGNSVTKLHSDKSDTVVVLTHTNTNTDTDTQSPLLTSTKVSNSKIVKQKQCDQGEALVFEESALWDIFRRQDVPKLEKYLRIHTADFCHTDCRSIKQIVHPIHDRVFYLNMEHKRKLKNEFGIEPWTFKQKLGDAVFIPAGCPYQVRNLKSSTKVELNFISPENLGECIRLQHELRILPSNHRAKQNKLNIGKMILYALDHAVMDLASDSNEPIGELQFVMVPETSNGYDANLSSHTNGWVDDTESDDSSHIVDHESATHEASPTSMPETSEDPNEIEGLWQGNAVGPEAKKLLEAIEHQYPNTFQGVQIRAEAIRVSVLKEFHVVIKGFLETSVDALAEERIISLRDDLNEYNRFGFDVSWAHKRLDMVQKLKFGNDPLPRELMALEVSLQPLKGRLGEVWKEYVEVREKLRVTQLEYDHATDAVKKKAWEMAQKYGAEYNHVLKGHLGSGILTRY